MISRTARRNGVLPDGTLVDAVLVIRFHSVSHRVDLAGESYPSFEMTFPGPSSFEIDQARSLLWESLPHLIAGA